MVTHCSTNRSIQCLFHAERTGCEIFIVLWPNTTSLYLLVNLYPRLIAKPIKDLGVQNNDQIMLPGRGGGIS